MKSEKGITLTSLVIYIMISTIVISAMAFMTSTFVNNIQQVKDQQNYAPEFNQFAMFFIQDVKSNKTATVTGKTVLFEDGTQYRYEKTEKQIYRNNMVIAKKIDDLSFTLRNVTVESTEKNIIDVRFKSGELNKTENPISFVLRYW